MCETFNTLNKHNDIYFVRLITSHYIQVLRSDAVTANIEFFILIFSFNLSMQLLKSFSQRSTQTRRTQTFPKELRVFVAIFEYSKGKEEDIFLWLLP